MTDTAKNNLITLLRTQERATLLLEILSDVIDDAYKIKSPLLTKLKKSLPIDLQTDLFSFLRNEGEDMTKKESFLKIIQEICTTLPTLPSISLTIALRPTFELETYLQKKIIQMNETTLLLDLEYNPEIIGGAIIKRNGLYKDYSVAKTLSIL